jgi:hypothetical protein
MIPKNQTDIAITKVVYDIMKVEIHCSSLQTTTIKYCIHNQSNELVRKGSFKGQMIQLRMAHMDDGQYRFNMYVEDELRLNLPFEKKTLDTFADLQMIYR